MKPDHDIFRHFAGSLTKSSRPSLYRLNTIDSSYSEQTESIEIEQNRVQVIIDPELLATSYSFVVWKEKVSFFGVRSWEKYVLNLDLHELSDQWVVKLVTWEEDKLKNKMYQRPEESFFLESVK
jgi:hypothetical protein